MAASRATATATSPLAAAPTAGQSLFYTDAEPAPPIELTASDGSHFSLAAHRGTAQLVFFGYTHCPDVCPLTVGTVGDAIAKAASPVQAVFVTVDPERDTTSWLADYSRYTPRGFAFVTGSDQQISQTAAAWNVRYARVDTTTPGEYEMTHTADVYAIDAAGTLRAHFPFGTDAATMDATLAQIVASTASTSRPRRPRRPRRGRLRRAAGVGRGPRRGGRVVVGLGGRPEPADPDHRRTGQAASMIPTRRSRFSS